MRFHPLLLQFLLLDIQKLPLQVLLACLKEIKKEKEEAGYTNYNFEYIKTALNTQTIFEVKKLIKELENKKTGFFAKIFNIKNMGRLKKLLGNKNIVERVPIMVL